MKFWQRMDPGATSRWVRTSQVKITGVVTRPKAAGEVRGRVAGIGISVPSTVTPFRLQLGPSKFHYQDRHTTAQLSVEGKPVLDQEPAGSEDRRRGRAHDGHWPRYGGG